ncbi:DinB family protein [Maribacter sp. 2-571]|uniref:DinB family protein n=1 Tax=Maribacter sp. 2-571 TaxID=3417569 RepID=UPI003D326F5E
MKKSALTLPEPPAYYARYIDLIGEEDQLIALLDKQLQNFPKFLKSIPAEKVHYAYGPDKWTIAQVLLHIFDTERVFQYRALSFARGDSTALPGFDQEVFAAGTDTGTRTMQSLIEEYEVVRRATLSIFRHMGLPSLERTGVASGLDWSVGAIGFFICGHQRYHRNLIRERYL